MPLIPPHAATCISTRVLVFVLKQTHLAFYDALVGFTGDVDLVHGPPQVVKEEGPVARSQVHLARLPGFDGALLRPLFQQDTSCAFIFDSSILERQSVENK